MNLTLEITKLSETPEILNSTLTQFERASSISASFLDLRADPVKTVYHDQYFSRYPIYSYKISNFKDRSIDR